MSQIRFLQGLEKLWESCFHCDNRVQVENISGALHWRWCPTGTWNPWWKQLPHCRFWLEYIPGTKKHLATWNKRVKIEIHQFNQVITYRRCSPPGIRGGNNSPIAASGWGTSPAPGNMMQLEIKEWISIFTHLFQVTVHQRCSSPGIIV